MKNINKYTKSELITKIKGLDENAKTRNNNESINNQTLSKLIITTLFNFKSILIKITLIAFIIRWIKKYSLIAKIWHIFNIISSFLLGFSLIDIYYWDVITWIKDTSIFKWYAELFYKVDSPKENRPVEFQENMIKRSIEDANGVQKTIDKDNWSINRNIKEKIIGNNEVLTNDELNKLDNQVETNYSKYLIIATGIVITASICYYYSDEIRTGAVSLIDWINSFRAGTGDSAGSGSNSSATPTSPNIPRLNRLDSIVPSSQIEDDIELIDKGKGRLLTSQSLEDLNEKVSSKWSEGSKSPSGSSSSSTETITPDSFAQELILKHVNRVWKTMIPSNIIDKVNFVESTQFNLENRDKLSENLDEIQNEIIKFNERISTIKTEGLLSVFEIKQTEVVRENLTTWNIEHSNKIFSLNASTHTNP